MKDYFNCNICPQSEHEGSFCRCEDKNIRIAKERRARGESPWNTYQPERLNPEDQLYENIVQLVCDSPNTANK